MGGRIGVEFRRFLARGILATPEGGLYGVPGEISTFRPGPVYNFLEFKALT